MLDRSLLAAGFAFGLVVFNAFLGLNIFLRPMWSIVSLGFGLAVTCAFWLRAAVAVCSAWSEPSARVVRFARKVGDRDSAWIARGFTIFLVGQIVGLALIVFGMVNRQEEEAPTFVPSRTAPASTPGGTP